MSKTNFCKNKTKEEMETLSMMIKRGMKAKNYNSFDLSDRTGIPSRTIRKDISDPEQIRLKDLRKICSVLGLKIVFTEEAKELEML